MYEQKLKWKKLFPLIKDTQITKIIGNNYNEIQYEKNNYYHNYEDIFESFEDCINYFNELLISELDLQIGEANPSISIIADRILISLTANFKNKRVMFIINKVPIYQKTLKQINMSQSYYEYLVDAIKQRKNIIITGINDAGKTTLLNALTSEFKITDRCVIVEDTALIQLTCGQLIKLYMGGPIIDKSILIKEALHDNYDYLLIDNCHGEEAKYMLKAMEYQKGIITTFTCSSPYEMPRRLGMKMLCNKENIQYTTSQILKLIGNIDIIVNMKYYPDGTRGVDGIYEIVFTDNDIQIYEI